MISDTCQQCAWFELGGAAIAKAARDPSAPAGTGTCNEAPPMIFPNVLENTAYYPVVLGSRKACSLFVPNVPDIGGDPGGGGREEAPTAEVVNLSDRRAA